MVDKPATVPAGTLLLVTSGSHDDYQPRLLCRAREELDIDALRGEWIETLEPWQRDVWAMDTQFLRWLLETRQAVEEVGCHELWLDSYSGDDFPGICKVKPWERAAESWWWDA